MERGFFRKDIGWRIIKINENYKWKIQRKNINFIKNSKTRPLKDSVKESIFNILVHSPKVKIKLENSSVLDLYSGVGSFGLECIFVVQEKLHLLRK